MPSTDPVAGQELEAMAADMLTVLRESCDMGEIVKTIDEYRGELDRDKGPREYSARHDFKAPAIFLHNSGFEFEGRGFMLSRWSLLAIAKEQAAKRKIARMNGARIIALTAARILAEVWGPSCGRAPVDMSGSNLFDRDADKAGLTFYAISFTLRSELVGLFSGAELTPFARAHGEAFMTDDQDDGSIEGETEIPQ